MERDDNTPHYQIHMTGEGGVDYRVAVNVMSSSEESELLYLVDEQFDASMITILPTMDYGFTQINGGNREIALDYIRSNLFDPSKMQPMPHNVEGTNNDLNELAKEVQDVKPDEKVNIIKQKTVNSKFSIFSAKVLKVLPKTAETIAGFTPLAPFSKIIGESVQDLVEALQKEI